MKSVVSACGSVFGGSDASRPTYLMLAKLALSPIEKPTAMFPSASIAELAIQRLRLSVGAYVLCCEIHQLPEVFASWYHRTPARSEPTSTDWLTTII